MSGIRLGVVSYSARAIAAVALAAALVAGCDSRAAAPTEVGQRVMPRYDVAQSAGSFTGVWSGVVTDAADLNNASFGRDPSDWVGRPVRGTFAIHLATSGIGDRDPNADSWVFGPVPGPGPFIEFVTVTALIDNHAFRTSRADYHTIFFGDVVGITDALGHSTFNPQDSYVGAGTQGIGRSVVGFDAFFAPGGVSFDGTSLSIDTHALQFGRGIIDDLLSDGTTVHRQGNISFRVTTVSLSRVGNLLEGVINLAALGTLSPDQVDGLLVKLDEVEAKLDGGLIRSACNQLVAFRNQVRAFIYTGDIDFVTGEALIAEVQVVRNALGC